MKTFKVAPKKNYFLYIIVGALFAVAGILFCPLWQKTDLPWADWGMQMVELLIAVCLLIYLFGFLLKKLTRSGGGVIGVLTIVEFVALLLVALGSILSQFRVISISGACAILGLCLWCRGTVEIFRAYYYQRGSSVRYPVWWLCVAIAMVSLGMYCIARPLFSDLTVLWIFVLLLLLTDNFLIRIGAMCKPKRK